MEVDPTRLRSIEADLLSLNVGIYTAWEKATERKDWRRARL